MVKDEKVKEIEGQDEYRLPITTTKELHSKVTAVAALRHISIGQAYQEASEDYIEKYLKKSAGI